MTVFSADHFEKFCALLKIDTKEQGQKPLRFIGTQRYFVQQVNDGLARGVHTFVCLKGRQLGISTVSLALDLYWMFLMKGLQGALITDTDSNKILFKSYLTQYLTSLPPRARVPAVEHNREQLILKNRSRLAYIVAGKRKNESLGAGKAVNFMHATECATWGDQDGIASLNATLAQQNPNRLYIWESTAFGFNGWYEICESAKRDPSALFMFIGWWRNEFYQIEPHDARYAQYWDGSPTTEEREWIKEVFEQYHHSITDKQLAWWRWYLHAKASGDINVMFQTFPPTENYAFQMSGSKFFSGERVNIAYKAAIEQDEPTFHRYTFGLRFEDTQFIDATEDTAEVSIWEEPVEGGVYCLGADPAYGSSEWADEFSISVLRCYSDRVVQVAELGTVDFQSEAQFAWAMAHLAGVYRPCFVILELQGPGMTVLNELQNLRTYGGSAGLDPNRKDIYNVAGNIRDYLWKKPDRWSGPGAYHWQSNQREKIRLMSTLRNYFEREMVQINSPRCVEQLRNIRREGDAIGGEGRAKDDRVIALGLAVIAWNDTLKQELEMDGRTFARESAPRGEARQVSPLERTVDQFFRRKGITFNG